MATSAASVLIDQLVQDMLSRSLLSGKTGSRSGCYAYELEITKYNISKVFSLDFAYELEITKYNISKVFSLDFATSTTGGSGYLYG